MIRPKTPDASTLRLVEAYLNELPFMASKDDVLRAMRELAVEFYMDGYFRGINDQLTGDVMQEDS